MTRFDNLSVEEMLARDQEMQREATALHTRYALSRAAWNMRDGKQT